MEPRPRVIGGAPSEGTRTVASAVRRPNTARIVLASIRLVNGVAAVVAPARLARLFGVDPNDAPASLYVLRLFGIRTVVLGWQLLRSDEERTMERLRVGVLIHGADAAAAATAGLRGWLPRRAAIAGAAISTTNTFLAVRALRSLERERAMA